MTILVLIPKWFVTPLHILCPLSHPFLESSFFPFSNSKEKKKLKNWTHKANDPTQQNPQQASDHQPPTKPTNPSVILTTPKQTQNQKHKPKPTKIQHTHQKPNSLSPIQTKTNPLQNPPPQRHCKEEDRREIANLPPRLDMAKRVRPVWLDPFGP